MKVSEHLPVLETGSLRIGVSAILALLLISCQSISTEESVATASGLLTYNQIGYLSNTNLDAIFFSEEPAISGQWSIVDNNGAVKKSSPIPEPVFSDELETYIYNLSLSTSDLPPGRYHISFLQHHSEQFTISSTVYEELTKSLLRSYYLQRCGWKIDDLLTNISHDICHSNDAELANPDTELTRAGKHLVSTGGWHDAGDYGKYVTTTTVTLIDILSRFDRHEGALEDVELSIPESGDEMPDILDEMAIGLDWLITMQRPDGALWRKLSGKEWPPLVVPEEDMQTRYIYGVSSPETAKAAAAWAIASRVYSRRDPEKAEIYLRAAEKAWKWNASQSEMVFDYRDGDDGGSGAYRYNEDDREPSLLTHDDDNLAAAIELYITTGNDLYREKILELLSHQKMALFEWKNPAAQPMMNLLFHPKTQNDFELTNSVKSKLKIRADESLDRSQQNPLKTANTAYIWGSNKMVAAEGSILSQAYKVFLNPAYADASWAQLHYLLGVNPLGQSFVTGFGSKSVTDVHHIFLRTTKKTIPGLMVGGPNTIAQSGIATAGDGPLSYADDALSYATNEYSIDYNGAFIALIWDLILTED